MAKDTANKTCFVVGPIGRPGTPERNHADWLNDGIIKPLFKEHFPSISTVRADEITVPGMIDAQVINHLFDADLVISDMSLRNANAFYEMGIRHAVQKPIIHMFKVGEEIPFDVQPYRAIEFSVAHPSDIDSAKDRLKAAVQRVLEEGYKVDNPVIRARGVVELEKNATAPERVLMDRFSVLEARLARVESRPPKSSNQHFASSLNYEFFWIAAKEKVTTAMLASVIKEMQNYIPLLGASHDASGGIAVRVAGPASESVELVSKHVVPKFPWIESVDEVPL